MIYESYMTEIKASNIRGWKSVTVYFNDFDHQAKENTSKLSQVEKECEDNLGLDYQMRRKGY